jgi:hypothetical protein
MWLRLPSAKLPDQLLYINLRNVGHVPSPTIKVRIVVPGQIADKLITDAGSAFGRVDQVNESDSTGELSFLCQNLANDPGARIKVALWYQRSGQGLPSVQIQDTSEGPAREVGSIDTARFYWWEWSERWTGFVGLFSAVLGFVLSSLLVSMHRRKRWIEKRVEEGSPALRAMEESLESRSRETNKMT